MRAFRAVTVGAILAGFIQSALAYSPIWNVDGWDLDRLGKAGISVDPWKHSLQGEDPPLEWVEVKFDCSKLPKKQDVLMTAWVLSEGKSVAALRSERNPKGDDTVSLLLAVSDDYRPRSRVDVFIWKEKPDGGSEASGFTLSLTRIVELARQKKANK